MKTLKEKIEVMQAALEGKAIQMMELDCHEDWQTLTPGQVGALTWDWSLFDYRIKPEPRTWLAVLYNQDGLVGGLYDSVQSAHKCCGGPRPIIKVQEIL